MIPTNCHPTGSFTTQTKRRLLEQCCHTHQQGWPLFACGYFTRCPCHILYCPLFLLLSVQLLMIQHPPPEIYSVNSWAELWGWSSDERLCSPWTWQFSSVFIYMSVAGLLQNKKAAIQTFPCHLFSSYALRRAAGQVPELKWAIAWYALEKSGMGWWHGDIGWYHKQAWEREGVRWKNRPQSLLLPFYLNFVLNLELMGCSGYLSI